jgi:GR25 family glycosyltransferase involved in LPS biosynthesis
MIIIISIGLAYIFHKYLPRIEEGFESLVDAEVKSKKSELPVDAVLYINLDERKDRDEEIKAEMSRIGLPENKIHRVSAVKRKWGALGCALSHIACMEFIIENRWNKVLILEDDAGFEDKDEKRWNKGLTDIKNMIDKSGVKNTDSKWDVILLGGFVRDPNGPEKSEHETLWKTRNTSCLHAYIVRGEYAPKILEVFHYSVQMLMKNPPNHKQYFIDNSISKLMETDRWYISIPTLAYQRESYSDIEGKQANEAQPLRGNVVRAWAKGSLLA